jgi:hypothetical protein
MNVWLSSVRFKYPQLIIMGLELLKMKAVPASEITILHCTACHNTALLTATYIQEMYF